MTVFENPIAISDAIKLMTEGKILLGNSDTFYRMVPGWSYIIQVYTRDGWTDTPQLDPTYREATAAEMVELSAMEKK